MLLHKARLLTNTYHRRHFSCVLLRWDPGTKWSRTETLSLVVATQFQKHCLMTRLNKNNRYSYPSVPGHAEQSRIIWNTISGFHVWGHNEKIVRTHCPMMKHFCCSIVNMLKYKQRFKQLLQLKTPQIY